VTPLQAAKEYCANYQPNGSCLGIYYKDDLNVDRLRYRPCSKCLLAQGKRCHYFEEIVVPMRMSRETAEAKVRADKKDAAVRTYLKSHNLISSKTSAKRMCLDCRKVQVEGRARFCHKCAERRNRRAYRLSKRRTRLDVQKLAFSLVRADGLTNAVETRRYVITADNAPAKLTHK
jgi:hypothetical protein